MLQAICCATLSETSERMCRRADKWKLQARTTVETCLLKLMVWSSVTPRSFKLSLTATQLSTTRRCVGCGGVLYCTVYCMPCTIIFEITFELVLTRHSLVMYLCMCRPTCWQGRHQKEGAGVHTLQWEDFFHENGKNNTVLSTRSLLWASNMPKIGGRGSASDTAGELAMLPRSPSRLKGGHPLPIPTPRRLRRLDSRSAVCNSASVTVGLASCLDESLLWIVCCYNNELWPRPWPWLANLT